MIHVFVEGYNFAMAIRQALTSTYDEVGLPLLVVGREVQWGEEKDSIAKIPVKMPPADYVSGDESKSNYVPPTIDHQQEQTTNRNIRRSRSAANLDSRGEETKTWTGSTNTDSRFSLEGEFFP